MLRLCLSLIFAGVTLAAAASLPAPAQAQGVYTPQRGSDERVQILNGIRPQVEGTLQMPVEFIVRTMNVTNGWAFVALDPQHPGGGRIDPNRTPLDPMAHDGLTVYALLRDQGAGWETVDWVIGPGDVAWETWPADHGAPAILFQ